MDQNAGFISEHHLIDTVNVKKPKKLNGLHIIKQDFDFQII